MSKMKGLVGIAVMAGIAIGVTGGAVGQDVIAQRKELMKQVAGAAKTSSDMIKGVKPYDAKAAEAAASTMAKNWVAFAKLFPDNSKTGGETRAAPKIWKQRKDFEDRLTRATKDAEAAVAAASQGAEAFKASFAEVAKNCNSCHDEYWLPRK
jgi:cytochrome c556